MISGFLYLTPGAIDIEMRTAGRYVLN